MGDEVSGDLGGRAAGGDLGLLGGGLDEVQPMIMVDLLGTLPLAVH